jgi:hypothetical protein
MQVKLVGLGALGCAVLICLTVFPVILIVGLVIDQGTIRERLIFAVPFSAAVSAMVLVVVLILSARDKWRFNKTRQSVRDRLLSRHDAPEIEFVRQIPDCDPVLVTKVRQAIAAFFEVPAEKVLPTDSLKSDLYWNELEPGIHWSVAGHVFRARNVVPKAWRFDSNQEDVGGVVREIARILNEFDRPAQAP